MANMIFFFREDWVKEKIEAEDIIKKLTTFSQDNVSRAQNAEVCILPLIYTQKPQIGDPPVDVS